MSTFPFCLLLHISFSFHFVSLLCYLYPCVVVFTSLPFVASVSSGLKKSFTSSSHLFLLAQNPGFHSAAFLTHRSFGGDAILIANHHFIFLCISITESWHPSFLQKRRRYLCRDRCQCCFFLDKLLFVRDTSRTLAQVILRP